MLNESFHKNVPTILYIEIKDREIEKERIEKEGCIIIQEHGIEIQS